MTARARLALDSLLLAAFIAAYFPAKTGLWLHEWLCLALLAPAFLHLVVNWDWCVRIAGAFFNRLRATSRVNLIVDAGLFISTVAVTLSGFLVSRVISAALGLTSVPDPVWFRVHALSADAVVALALVHLALHWRWVVRIIRVRILGVPSRPQPGHPGQGLVPSPDRWTSIKGDLHG